MAYEPRLDSEWSVWPWRLKGKEICSKLPIHESWIDILLSHTNVSKELRAGRGLDLVWMGISEKSQCA